jgi:signal-transduction protein with cAMP-binding, CBS, and nucleotidyltransferase domain
VAHDRFMARVRDLITRPAVTCGRTATLPEIAREMHENNVGSVVVVDKEKKPIGIVTDRDIVVRALARGLPMTTTADTVMTHSVARVHWDSEADDALHQMSLWACRRIPVVNDEGRIAGVVTLDDLTVEMANAAEDVIRVERTARATPTA